MKRILILLALLPGLVFAHAVPHPRQLQVRATPTELHLDFSYELNPAEARRVRRLFDADRDGVLSPTELEKLSVYLEGRAVGSFELRQKGAPVAADASAREVSGADAARGNLSVRVTRTWKLEPGAHAFTVRDEGDSMGHMPVRLHAKGVRLSFGGVKLGHSYDLPARTEVSLSVRPEK